MSNFTARIAIGASKKQAAKNKDNSQQERNEDEEHARDCTN